MSLSARERAERIRDLFRDEGPVPDYLMPKIAAEIEEAVRDERGYWQEFMRLNKFEDQSDTRREARAEALEQAAKNLEAEASRLHSKAREVKDHLDTWMDHHSNAFREAAARIRALAKREGK